MFYYCTNDQFGELKLLLLLSLLLLLLLLLLLYLYIRTHTNTLTHTQTQVITCLYIYAIILHSINVCMLAHSMTIHSFKILNMHAHTYSQSLMRKYMYTGMGTSH